MIMCSAETRFCYAGAFYNRVQSTDALSPVYSHVCGINRLVGSIPQFPDMVITAIQLRGILIRKFEVTIRAVGITVCTKHGQAHTTLCAIETAHGHIRDAH